MRATNPGMTIGQALSGFSGSGQGTVTVFIKNTYYPGNGTITLSGNSVDGPGTDSNLQAPTESSDSMQNGAPVDGDLSNDEDTTSDSNTPSGTDNTPQNTSTVQLAGNIVASGLTVTGNTALQGKLVIQGGGKDIFSVSVGGIVLGAHTQVGSATVDGEQVNLQLDSSSNWADAGSCSATTNQGAMYYNANSESIRTCQDGSWSDVVTTKDLGLLLFGVVPDSGDNAPGDLPSLVDPGKSGPCKVSWASSSSVYVQSCVAYSGGRRVNVHATTVNITGMSAVNSWATICLTGPGSQPALSAAGSETSSSIYPAFSVTAPVLCLAQVRASGNHISGIYDTRTFTSTSKEFINTSKPLALGALVDSKGSGFVPASANSERLYGVVVATNGGTSDSSPNAIVVTNGPAWVKANSGSAGQIVKTDSNGHASTSYDIPNNAFFYTIGISRTSFSNSCTAASNCNGSLYVNAEVR
jgi:hypothetical protein